MRKYLERIYITLLLIILVLFESGCTSQVESITALQTDPTLPTIHHVKTEVDTSSIGFEWDLIKDSRVQGIDVYRAINTGRVEETFKKIATLGNRYVTHFVDTDIVPNTNYIYTFRTFGLFKGSAPGKVIKVKAPPPLPGVELVSVYLVDSGVVKILWKPHPYAGVYDYVIERKLQGRSWKYLATVKGRLSPEYIDMSAAKGYHYSYRVVARFADKIRTKPSNSISLLVQ
jgi:fibronectin type 3 domain-containing protein